MEGLEGAKRCNAAKVRRQRFVDADTAFLAFLGISPLQNQRTFASQKTPVLALLTNTKNNKAMKPLAMWKHFKLSM